MRGQSPRPIRCCSENTAKPSDFCLICIAKVSWGFVRPLQFLWGKAMRFFFAGVGMAATLVLAGCAGTAIAPRWQHASNRHHHHGVHSVWRTATTGRSSTGAGGSTGLASFYRASRTASGERPSSGDLTAAHPNLPFGTRVRVTNLNNHRSVTVRINDRGPFVTNRSIDLSYGAASAIGMTGAGVARVHMEVLQ